tara:strand:- start:18202 stop:18966 length:765 start_codon:yes stop_codon:yes gene_type:complete
MNDKNKKEIFKDNLIFIKKNYPHLSNYQAEKITENLFCTNLLYEKKEIKDWFKQKKISFKSTVKQRPINKLEGWTQENNGNLVHESGKFFSIVGVRVSENSNREIGNKGWDQPIVKEYDFNGGLLGLIRTKIEGLPHYLVQARFEPGNYGIIQLGPTLQATFSNFNQEHGGRKPYYHEFFEDYKIKKNYQFNNWLSEDGGKFLNKRNLGLVKNIHSNKVKEINDDFRWMSLFQINELMYSNSIINPHLARLINL